MKRREKFLAVLTVLLLLCCGVPAAGGAETIQECHRVTSTASETKQENNSRVKLWQVETAHPAVSEEVNGIAAKWAEDLAPELEGTAGYRQLDFLDAALPDVLADRTVNAQIAVAMKHVVRMLRIHQEMGFENVL